MKNILITKSKEPSKDLTNLLSREGFNPIFEPLLNVEKLDVTKQIVNLETDKISALIITSANSASAIINSNLPKNIKIFAVGEKSADELLQCGFKSIVFARQKSASSLKDVIIEKFSDKSGSIIYFHGEKVTLDFKEELEKFGFKVKNILSYKAREVEKFSDELLKFALRDSFQYVLVFSQNSAKNFIRLAKNHNLLEYFKASRILCLSEKILLELQDSGFKNSTTFNELPILSDFYG